MTIDHINSDIDSDRGSDMNFNVNLYRFYMDTKEDAEMLLLILASEGVDLYLMHHNQGYELIVKHDPDYDIEFIREVIASFYAENIATNCVEHNSDESGHAFKSSSENQFILTQSAVTSVSMFVLLLCTVHAATIFHNNHREVVLKYGSSALYVLQGEYYRVITALLLHADIEHLAGNVAGMLFLAVPLCSITGAGRGMFLVILSGGAGNLVNACLYRSAHLSIGASTAVMGAVGILVALQIINRRGQHQPMKQLQPTREHRQLPTIFILACGAAFVGMMSGGKETDLSAHVFGFLAGLIFGFPGLVGLKQFKNHTLRA